ncbi:condensin-2 complex subunit G2 [Syngnathoides biaculeatus]|uniref:condensin-2 complex subunit G2 n=1 Tax=Syngnathoides biaculeatus TaxID=300417 RepID=UPI002ADE1C7A|nr:condensin-2 complex subunit G2 [Syngnathoides biaculeatus]
MSKREAFVEAACKENVDDFLDLIQLHKNKMDPFDAEEVMQEMSRDQREALWGKLASLLRHFLLEAPPERWEEATDADVDVKRAKAVVAGVTLVANVSLKVLQDGDTYNGLLQIIQQLHNVLLLLPVTETHVLLHIRALCETWWKKNLRQRDKFGHAAFVIALKKSFLLPKPSPELQRLWNLHQVLLNVDYASEAGEQLGKELLQCFLRPPFICNDDGKRLMVFLFSWHVDFIPLIHGTIKNQLQFFNTTVVSHITEVYFRAWKKASGSFLETIESECIQDLMKCAILIHRSSPIRNKVQQIVFFFHKNKAYTPVVKMLSALYKPILWKNLNVPNFEVRANATVLFTDAFPILDPNQEIELALQKQLDMVMALLFDKHPCVRCNAILGMCKILARCWDLLPAVVIVDFLKKFEELAGDCSSDEVRCAVFTYLCMVLDNVLSHPMLEKMMPRFKNSLHDISEKVRVAFVDLLLKFKAVRAGKFWDVCSLDHLVVRLASDKPHVSKRLAALLFDSYFPAEASERDLCGRCISLIQMNPMAARKFYQYAHLHTAPANIVKLMMAIRRILNKCIPRNDDDSELTDSNKENSMPLGENPLGLEKDAIGSLMEVVVILWNTINRTLHHNEETQKQVYNQFAAVMPKYFSAFTDEQCQVALIQMASFMPASMVPTFSYGLLSRLRKMDADAQPSAYGQLLDCMCSWGKTAGVIELISDWLSEALPKTRGERSKRKVTIQVTMEAKPQLALGYLDYLLLHRSTRDKVLALSQGPLKQLHTQLGKWKSLLYSHLSSSTHGLPGADLGLKVFTFHARLSVHLQHNLSDGREYLGCLEDTATWVGEKVLPFLPDSNQGDGDDEAERSRALAAEITKSFLSVCTDTLICLADDNFKYHILHLCSLVVLSEKGYLCIPALLRVLKELTESCQLTEKGQDVATKCLVAVANIFQSVIELLARLFKKEPEEGKLLCQSTLSVLADFLQVAQACNLSGIFDTLFAIVVVETRYALQKMTHPEQVVTPETTEDLPPLSGILLSVILKSPRVAKAFSAELLSSLDSDTLSTLTELAAVVQILAVLCHAGQSNACLKRAGVTVQRQMGTHADADGDVQRALYQCSVTTLNELLTHWADK